MGLPSGDGVELAELGHQTVLLPDVPHPDLGMDVVASAGGLPQPWWWWGTKWGTKPDVAQTIQAEPDLADLA